METSHERETETRDEAIARVLRAGRPALSEDELYGPGPGPEDPEDLEEFLAILASMKQPVRVPDEDM